MRSFCLFPPRLEWDVQSSGRPHMTAVLRLLLLEPSLSFTGFPPHFPPFIPHFYSTDPPASERKILHNG